MKDYYRKLDGFTATTPTLSNDFEELRKIAKNTLQTLQSLHCCIMQRLVDIIELIGRAIWVWDGWVSHADYELLEQGIELVRNQCIGKYQTGTDKEAFEAWARTWSFQREFQRYYVRGVYDI